MHRPTLCITAALSVAFALSACGGGGGGSSSGASTTATPVSNGAALLAAYVVPSSVASEQVDNYPTAFSVGNTGLASNCSIASNTSTTVFVTPDAVVYRTNGVSLKAQQLAVDLTTQGIAQVRAFFGLATSTGFDGTNKVQVCVDNTMGTSIGETGSGVSGSAAQNVFTVISGDSTNFDARYPGATTYLGTAGYGSLVTHELVHVFHDAVTIGFGAGMDRWFQEGLATTVVAAGAALPAKATVLAELDSADLVTPTGSTSLNVYDAYRALMTYMLSSKGLNYSPTAIPAFLAVFKSDAIAACQVAIQSGVGPTAAQLAGFPTGYYNDCIKADGLIDDRVRTAFDTAFNATFKNSDGTPLLLHTADGANSLEATSHDRLNTFLTQ